MATFEIRDSYKAGKLMARLPQQYAPLVYGIIQAAITTAVATAIATYQLTDFRMRFVEEWLFAWGLAFLTMLPVVVFVSPFIQRCVLALTVFTADDGRPSSHSAKLGSSDQPSGWVSADEVCSICLRLHIALRAFVGHRLFSMATPIGGSILITAWVALAVGAVLALVRS